MAIQRPIFAAIIASCLISTAWATAGTATYYTTYVPSSCYGYQDQDTMIAAANPSLFNNKAACGQRYRVQCTSGTNQGTPQPCRNGVITVTIVDLCPGCGNNQLDLSIQAFSIIADPNAGRINIKYDRVG